MKAQSFVHSPRIVLLTAVCGAVASLTTGHALAQDVTAPGDVVVGSSTNYPAGEPPESAIDNTAQTKYLNFDKLNTGFTVTPSGTGIVRSIGIITANDAPERDPTSYILEGTNDGVNFSLIAQGALNPDVARFAINQVAFANVTAFSQYRVTFPTVRVASSANSMQVAEVQLSTNINVLTPGDPFTTVYTTGASSGTNETAAQLFDNRLNTKFGIFNGNLGPTTVTVTPGAGSSVVTGLEVYGGNDDQAFGGRTPATITLSGSNDGVNFTQLFDGPLTQVVANYQGQQYSFANTTAYRHYQITFGASVADFTQIGELRLMGTVSGAAPANDTCANAQTVTAGATPGSNFNATGTDTTACGDSDSLDVWYSYHAVNSGLLEINTFGDGQLDTVLAVYDGCGGALMGCNDNARGSKSRVRFTAAANHDYKIRVAGAGNSTGAFTLNVLTAPVVHSDAQLALNYNFNGMVQNGEAGNADALDGFRSISDRGIYLSGAVGSLEVGLEGLTGIPYSVVTTPNTLDIVHLGDRNQVDGFRDIFDIDVDGDEIGVQPTWLPNTDQTGPQTTTLAAPTVMGPDTQIGVIYNASNGGNSIQLVLNFSDSSSAVVMLDAPDWYGEQVAPAPELGVASQAMLGTYHASQTHDLAEEGVNLNVIEAVVTTTSLADAGLQVSGKQLNSISFQTVNGPNAAIAVYAATVRDGGTVCTADFNGDTVVDFFDYLDFVQAFAANDPIADFNHDSVIDLFDYLDFVLAFSGGC